jgi:hypothetical protein
MDEMEVDDDEDEAEAEDDDDSADTVSSNIALILEAFFREHLYLIASCSNLRAQSMKVSVLMS